jgi:apoptosis-inducing factor 2
MSKNSSSKKNVVVLGGGFGGVLVAQGLSAKLDHSTHNLILVDARPQNIHIIAGLRLVVTEDKTYPDTVVFSYDRVFKPGKGTVKYGKVISFDANKSVKGGRLVFADGETLAYDGQLFLPHYFLFVLTTTTTHF